MRVRLHIAYDGSAYCGWQIQKDDRTVEGELTEAIADICDRPANEMKVTGASRTDSGVHALGQVAHIDLPVERDAWELVSGLNGLTDDDLCVNRLETVDGEFHARYDASGKLYRYDIWNHRFSHPIRRRQSWHRYDELDFSLLEEAASRLEGTHDFAAFRASDGQAPTTERTIRRVEIERPSPLTGESPGQLIRIWVEGDAFLKYMVRVMVGTMFEIANGRHTLDSIDRAFGSGDRTDAGITAPGCGLTLVRVMYPDHPWEDDAPCIGGDYLV